MLEFDSISVSSYEADTLAQQLTERSTAGWDVVSIVSAGSSVTAYLSRPAGSAGDAEVAASTPDATESAVEDFGGEEIGPLGDADVAHSEGSDATDVFGGATQTSGESAWSPEPADTPSNADSPASFDAETSTSSWGTTDATDTSSAPEHDPAANIESGTSSPNLADDIAALASQIHDDEVPAATSEPAGWAASSDAGTAEPALPGSGVANEPVEPVAEPVVEPVTEAPAEPVVEPQPAAASAAPPGWYADPSGRFELRYWDGGQWTEHVSRAGQQYTDPPVA